MDKQWHEILTISEAMLVAAKNEQWDPLIELESVRQKLLVVYFDEEVQVGELELVTHGIDFILKSDKEISEIVKLHSLKIKDELSKLKSNRIAISNYNQISD